MIRKVHHIAVLIDCEREQAIHWFELFHQIKQNLRSTIQFVIWDSDLADIARSIVDVDTVHLLSRSLFKLNDYQSMRELIQNYTIDTCIEIGNIPQFITWNLRQNPTIQQVRVYNSLLEKTIAGYAMNIYPEYTARVNFQKRIAYSPFPLINYQHFLDLDTQLVLDIKQNTGLVQYENQVIQKAFVCGHVGSMSSDLIAYLEYNNCEWYDVQNQKGSFVFPQGIQNELPIIYELLDCLIVSGPIDEIISYHILNALASGTIVIAPREEIYQTLLGRGALYYNQSSTSQLNACIDVLQRNESKKREIRDYASAQFQRKYSYQAIAQFWAQLLAKV
jgi:glycosyltransferase involved in cell wall biosynthesis